MAASDALGPLSIQRSLQVQRNARLVVIDSLSGYLAAMPGKPFLMLQLHELLAYLGQKAVTTLLVHGQKGGFLRSRQRSPTWM